MGREAEGGGGRGGECWCVRQESKPRMAGRESCLTLQKSSGEFEIPNKSSSGQILRFSPASLSLSSPEFPGIILICLLPKRKRTRTRARSGNVESWLRLGVGNGVVGCEWLGRSCMSKLMCVPESISMLSHYFPTILT